MQSLNEELFLTLSKIIDARDPYVGGHASKVGDYAVAIAHDLGVEPERFEPLRQAGFLHDIGKIAISEAVLHKPSKLTDEEYEYIKTHAALGGEFLATCRSLRHLAPFVRHHHERWDGRGYPDKLAGEDIPLEARILAVCDAVEAMASDRPYRKGMSLDEVIAEVKRCAGTQFDPHVAAAFVSIAERERDHLIVNSATEVHRRPLQPRSRQRRVLEQHAAFRREANHRRAAQDRPPRNRPARCQQPEHRPALDGDSVLALLLGRGYNHAERHSTTLSLRNYP
jgi:HD-GYP domain-containing protein (c-di-GMP phosphodiesterase class II)